MKTVKFPNLVEVEAQAAAWISKIDRGLSSTENRELDGWLEQSPVHGDVLLKCASMWDMLDILRPISSLMPMDEIEPVKYHEAAVTNSEPSSPASWKLGFAMAASLTVLIGAIAYNVNLTSGVQPAPITVSSPSVREQHYQTEVGEISTVALSDGSLLQLNTDSLVKVRYSSSQRHINLVRGEVFFDVAKNEHKPFVVESGEDRVTAIGTAFSVDASNQSTVEVIVTEGKVRVDRTTAGQLPAYKELYLTPGQSVVVRDDRPVVRVDHDPESSLAWREGMVIFQGESLAEVIREIDRYTPLSFRLVDQELASISVGGFFKTGDLDQLLLVLEQNFGVAYEKKDDEVLLSKAIQ